MTSRRSLIACLLAGALLASAPASPELVAQEAGRPSFIVVMTDDQRWDSLWAMPFVDRTLRPQAVEFVNAYVTTPMCCPSRAGFLAGGFLAQNTGVIANGWPNGGASRFDDRRSMAVQLQRAGYRTGIVGKYLNEYQALLPYVPRGWDRFIVSVRAGDFNDFDIARGSSTPDANGWAKLETHGGHITDFQFAEALAFLDELGDEPFFLFVSLNAPHRPATPQWQDRELFPGYRYRGRTWGERRLDDKPAWVQRRATAFGAERPEADGFHRDQLRTLRGVDRGVRTLWDRVQASGRADEVVWVFTSDNGYMWGEHRLFGKSVPYDEALRVPLLVIAPDTAPRSEPRVAAMNLDVPATVLDLARLYPTPSDLARRTDGLSLAPLLRGESPPWRRELFVENYVPLFATVFELADPNVRRSADSVPWTRKYTEFDGARFEAYADDDPLEERSLVDDRGFRRDHWPRLRERLAELRGLAMTTGTLPAARAGEPYDQRLESIGGRAPTRWRVLWGDLPGGVRLGAGGRLYGVPETVGEFQVMVEVSDSSRARYTGEPQRFRRELTLRVRNP